MPKKGRLLNWQPGFSLIRKPAKKLITRRRKQQSADAVQQYEFICEDPTKSFNEASRPLGTCIAFSTTSEVAIAPATDDRVGHDSPASPSVDEPILLSDNPPEALTGISRLGAIEYAVDGGNGCHTIGYPERLYPNTEVSPRFQRPITPHVDLTTQNHDYQIWGPSSILYNSVAHRFEPVLDQCASSHTGPFRDGEKD